ncbi:MAG: FAD-dependent oxidoreductase [Acidimicrobiia bacterium]|nr:FAD-dependent oxidoreductase [Acidimicrobiia bacterium]
MSSEAPPRSEAAPGGPAAPPYPLLFSPLRIGPLEIRNRVIFAGHGSRFVDWHSHHLTERQGHYLAERAAGGVGLVIQGSSMVHPTGLAAAGVNEVYSDDGIPAYARVAEMVKAEGAAIFGQLSHLGRQGDTFAAHRELWAPSALADPASRVVPHAMTRRDVAELTACYRSAAGRLVAAGFDGLEVYLAHGYLLCEFLSRFSNRRTDGYGGSLENRCRLPLEVLEAVRAQVGDGVPVGIRVSAEEFVPGGLTPGECSEVVAHLMARTRVDYVSVSQSNYASIDRMIPDMSFPRAPFAHYAAEIREATAGVPTFAVARLVTPDQCEELLATGTADAVCLVRPLIADPEWASKAASGRREDIRECISCNVGCRGGPHRGSPIACLVNPAVGEEARWGFRRLTKAARARRVVVIGGGPGGLKAAETAAVRGHEVILLEATERLGGQVLVAAAAMPYRDEFANSVRHLEGQIRKLGVEVRTGVRADAATALADDPSSVIVATGSFPGKLDVPGGELVHPVQEAIAAGVAGPRVVLVDAGEAGWKVCTTAENLAAAGHEVTLVSPVGVGASMDAFSRPPMLRRLRTAGVAFLEYHTLSAVRSGVAEVSETLTGVPRLLAADSVVGASYGVADDALFGELRALSEAGEAPGVELHAVGDCLAPRQAIDAIWDAFRVARTL